MKRAIKKLNNSSGNTLMMALLFMLVATVVSVIVLGAAASAARQVRHDKSRQQAYLALSSAAQLLRDSITDDSCKFSVTKYISLGESVPEKADSIVSEKAALEFSKLLNEAVGYIRQFGAPYVNENMAVKMNGLPSVSLKFRMETDYSIEIELSIEDTEGYEGYMTLAIDGCESKSVSYGSLDNEYDLELSETLITWSGGIIGKGTF